MAQGVNERKSLIIEILNRLALPYDESCVNYITENWEKDHEEEIAESEYYFEIDEIDATAYWLSYVKEVFERKC